MGTSPDESILDSNLLQEIYDLQGPHSPHLFQMVLRTYLEVAGPLVEDVRRGLLTGQAETVRLAAHSLKGSSRTVGATRLGKACDDLERATGEKGLQNITGLAQKLFEEFVLAKDAVKRLLQE